jgi:hypothetical protein
LQDVRDLLGLYPLVDLFAVHGYVLRCGETEAQLVSPDGEHSDGDVIADLHGLSRTPCQNQHWYSLPLIYVIFLQRAP